MIHMVQVSHELVECTMSLANTLCYGGAIVFTMMVGVACVTAAGYPVAHYLLWPLELLPSMRSALCYAHGLPLAKLRCYRVNLPSSCSFGMLACIADRRNDSPAAFRSFEGVSLVGLAVVAALLLPPLHVAPVANRPTPAPTPKPPPPLPSCMLPDAASRSRCWFGE